MKEAIPYQIHGYRNGHQLLEASARLARRDQDTVDRLSDMAGPLRPGEIFNPYLTAYPLPSRSHFVFARTWQDTEAPRAGCVLTKSLLIPMSLWERLDSFEGLFSELDHLPHDESAKFIQPTYAEDCSLPRVLDPRTVELIEAMFLEGRQPIVFFESQEADSIVKRLLLALWPSLRRNFAVCSFSLAPRKIDGRDFDLLFAPKTSRSRFADWPGRRIDIAGSREPRHRWSNTIASQIFLSERPNLIANDTLGVLMTDLRGDESSLRLSLLWTELLAKSEKTPSAVLGLLDILNSRPEQAPKVYERLSPIVMKALLLAKSSLGQADTWSFLATLVAKFPRDVPPSPIRRTIRSVATSLAADDHHAALDFLDNQLTASRKVPFILMAGIGDGVGSSNVSDYTYENLSIIPVRIGLDLIASSSKFARYVSSQITSDPEGCVPHVLRFFEMSDGSIRKKARRRLTPFLNDGIHSPLLPALLEGVTSRELSEFAVRLGRVTNFEIGSFDEKIIDAVDDSQGLNALRNSIVRNFQSPSADRFIFKTLRPDIQSFDWLTGDSIGSKRAHPLLICLLETLSDRNVQSVLAKKEIRDKILNLLLFDLQLAASQIARVLILGDPTIDVLLDQGKNVLPYLTQEERKGLSRVIFEKSLLNADPDDQRVHWILPQVVSQIDPWQIIQLALPLAARTSRIKANVQLLNSLPDQQRAGVLAHIDDLSTNLVDRRCENLGVETYEAWAQMIRDAGHVNHEAQLRAAFVTLAYALEQVESPVSLLIVETFPIVYAQLLRSKEQDNLKSKPSLLTLPFTFFADWDRSKSARRDLVAAFLKSSWPPGNLLLTGLKAEVDQKILRRVSLSYGGNQYIEAIEHDSYNFPVDIQIRLKNAIAQYRTNRFNSDWD